MSKRTIDPSIAEEAIAIVNGPRHDSYGHPRDNFQETADLWSPILGIKVTPEQVALCMVQVKIAREIHSPKRDNLVDAIGYLLTYNAVIQPDDEVCICTGGCTYCSDLV
jgi:hypothetical protein